MTDDPPPQLIRSLVDGPSRIAGFEWHASTTSTNAVATAAARRGAPEWHVVAADEQTAGRGRADRTWSAPAGTSLLLSIVLRPTVPAERLPLLPLLAGMALAEVVEAHVEVAAADVALKWPNDVLVRGDALQPWRKVAGILIEVPQPGMAILGIGCNVDWHDHEPPRGGPGGLGAASLAEVKGAPVDRWRVLAALLGVLGNRYDLWCDLPGAFLDGYRRRCATLGQEVVVTRPAAAPLIGTATAVADDGALEVRTGAGARVRVSAGDVTHVRPT